MSPVFELAAMEAGELENRLAESRQELFNLRFQLATGQLDNTARVRQVRREIARILTVLRQREIEELESAYGGVEPSGRPAQGSGGRPARQPQPAVPGAPDVEDTGGATGDEADDEEEVDQGGAAAELDEEVR